MKSDWGVTTNFESKREIIRVMRGSEKQVEMPGMEQPEQTQFPEYEEVWTGDYVFDVHARHTTQMNP